MRDYVSCRPRCLPHLGRELLEGNEFAPRRLVLRVGAELIARTLRRVQFNTRVGRGCFEGKVSGASRLEGVGLILGARLVSGVLPTAHLGTAHGDRCDGTKGWGKRGGPAPKAVPWCPHTQSFADPNIPFDLAKRQLGRSLAFLWVKAQPGARFGDRWLALGFFFSLGTRDGGLRPDTHRGDHTRDRAAHVDRPARTPRAPARASHRRLGRTRPADRSRLRSHSPLLRKGAHAAPSPPPPSLT